MSATRMRLDVMAARLGHEALPLRVLPLLVILSPLPLALSWLASANGRRLCPDSPR